MLPSVLIANRGEIACRIIRTARRLKIRSIAVYSQADAGAPPAAIHAMGLKDGAKALAEKAGVPVVPGYHGSRQEADFLRQKAYETGYPVLIKAIAGGGGKGMRRVDRQQDFDAALESARR